MQTRVHKIGLCINLGQNRERREADRTHTDQRNFVGSQANKSQSQSHVRKKENQKFGKEERDLVQYIPCLKAAMAKAKYGHYRTGRGSPNICNYLNVLLITAHHFTDGMPAGIQNWPSLINTTRNGFK